MEIKSSKTLLTERVNPGYLFMGLLKKTLPIAQQLVSFEVTSPSFSLSVSQTHALDTFLSRLTCRGIPVIQAEPCQVEESLSQGRDTGGLGGGGGGKGGLVQ